MDQERYPGFPETYQVSSWTVEKRVSDASGRPGTFFVVLRNDGWIANSYYYDEKDKASGRCELLNLLFGGGHDNNRN